MSSSEERVQIFIDGANFYHIAMKKLGIKEVEFLFDEFAEFLADGRTITEGGKRYYTGTVREVEGDPKSKKAMSRQTSLFSILESSKWEIKTSKLRLRQEIIKIDDRVEEYEKILEAGIEEIRYQRWREKGIDVKLATDLIVGSIDGKFDTAIIVSSDSDMIPAIDWIRRRQNNKVKVEYIGFSIKDPEYPEDPEKATKPTQGLIAYSDIQRILVASDVRKFHKFQETLLEDEEDTTVEPSEPSPVS